MHPHPLHTHLHTHHHHHTTTHSPKHKIVPNNNIYKARYTLVHSNNNIYPNIYNNAVYYTVTLLIDAMRQSSFALSIVTVITQPPYPYAAVLQQLLKQKETRMMSSTTKQNIQRRSLDAINRSAECLDINESVALFC